MGKIKAYLLALIVFDMVILSGCWDMREINELGLVTAVGIDKANGSNRYAVTVQIANPTSAGASENSNGPGGGSGGSPVWIGTEEGASLFDAIRKLVAISSRRIIWAHNNVVIIGESLAKEGIIPVVDYFSHNPELRMKTIVAVAKGNARDYIPAKIGMETPSGLSFIMLESYRYLTAESVESQMLTVSSALRNDYGNPIISEVSLPKRAMQPASGKGGEQFGQTLELSGAAVFKKDRMIGWLTRQECRGVSWMLNETKNTVVTVFDPEHDNRGVAVETSGVKAKIRSKIVDGMPEFTISISGSGDIAEEDASTNSGISEMKSNISRLVDKKIEEDVKSSLETIQKKYMVDCLGFAAICHTQNNEKWHEGIKDRWQEIFPKIPVSVSVDIKINTSTLNQEPMKIK